jgi:hypothetical protein
MRIMLVTMLLAAAGVAIAQEGFPLDGTWRGERPAAGAAGSKVTGVINPGPKAIPITDAKLIPEGWRVTVAAQTAAGQPVAFEGVLGELGSYNRTITGTWTEGGQRYPVRMVRE